MFACVDKILRTLGVRFLLTSDAGTFRTYPNLFPYSTVPDSLGNFLPACLIISGKWLLLCISRLDWAGSGQKCCVEPFNVCTERLGG